MNPANIEDFYSAIDDLVRINHNNRKQLREGENNFNPVSWALDFCTVRVDVGRRAGKTSYLLNTARRGDLVVSGYPLDKDLTEAAVVTPESLSSVLRTCQEFNTIFIDEPAQVFRQIRKVTLYEMLVVPGKEQTFILLGE